jgi:hypothetical protein
MHLRRFPSARRRRSFSSLSTRASSWPGRSVLVLARGDLLDILDDGAANLVDGAQWG